MASDQAEAIAADLQPIEGAARMLRIDGLTACAASVAPQSFDELHPAEQAIASSGILSRRQEFASGRFAAKRALLVAGHPSAIVLADDDGVPTFPDGYLGSIAHKLGRAISVVMPVSAGTRVGVDLEFDETHCDEGLRDDGAVRAEEDQFPALRAADPGMLSVATLVLCAKEALYKAVFPVLRLRFDFEDAEVAFVPSNRAFRGRRFPGSDFVTVHGRYERIGRWIVAVAIAKY